MSEPLTNRPARESRSPPQVIEDARQLRRGCLTGVDCVTGRNRRRALVEVCPRRWRSRRAQSSLSEIIFTLFDLLGLHFAPRLASLGGCDEQLAGVAGGGDAEQLGCARRGAGDASCRGRRRDAQQPTFP